MYEIYPATPYDESVQGAQLLLSYVAAGRRQNPGDGIDCVALLRTSRNVRARREIIVLKIEETFLVIQTCIKHQSQEGKR